MNWLIARLYEPSSWRGIILLLTVCGMKLEPDQQEAIIAAGLAIVGLLGVFTKDKANDLSAMDSAPAKAEYVPGFTIELQSRLDRGLPVPDAADSDQPAPVDSPAVDRRRADRVSTAMQSPISSESRSDTKPNFSGWNDQ
jgi:hypothetical protein